MTKRIRVNLNEGKPVNPEELQFIRSNQALSSQQGRLSLSELSEVLSRPDRETGYLVAYHKYLLGGVCPDFPGFTASEARFILENTVFLGGPKDMDSIDIALRLSKSEDEIRHFRSLVPRINKPALFGAIKLSAVLEPLPTPGGSLDEPVLVNFWSPEEEHRLSQHLNSSIEELMRMFPNRTRIALQRRVEKLRNAIRSSPPALPSPPQKKLSLPEPPPGPPPVAEFFFTPIGGEKVSIDTLTRLAAKEIVRHVLSSNANASKEELMEIMFFQGMFNANSPIQISLRSNPFEKKN